MKLIERDVALINHEYYIDGIAGSQYTSRQVFTCRGKLFVVIDELCVDKLHDIAVNYVGQYSTKSIVCLCSHLRVRQISEMWEKTSSKFYSWFGFTFDPALSRFDFAYSKSALEGFDVSVGMPISKVEKETLLKLWQKHYIEKVLLGYPEKIRHRYLEEFQQRLGSDNENRHTIVRQDSEIVAHQMLRRLFTEQRNCWDKELHFWVDGQLNKSIRREIHRRFWYEVHEASRKHMVLGGVASNNISSIKHLIKNGGRLLFIQYIGLSSY